MSITLGTQSAVIANSTPSLQQWNLNPQYITVDYYQGSAMPAAVTAAVKFKDVLGTGQVINYTNIRYRTYIDIPATTPQCVMMSGTLFTGINTYTAYGNGLQADMVYTFQNFTALATGTYTFTSYYQIWGVNATGVNTLLEERTLVVTIHIFSATAPVVTPGALEAVWIIGQSGPVLLPTFTISGANWTIKTPYASAFTTPPAGTTLVQPAAWGGAELTGSGTASLTIGMFIGAVPAPLEQNPVTFYLDINGGLMQIPITITFIEPSGLFLQKDSLYFIAYKGIQDAPAQQVAMYFGQQYNISCPPWMQRTPVTGINSSTVTFTPLSANIMEQGIYQDKALITNAATGVVLGAINLTYEVVTSVLSPYAQGAFAYTLDNVFFQFLSTLQDAYFSLQLNVRAYDFYASTYTDQSFDFKVALFRGKQKFNIGQVVDRLMAKITNLAQDSATAYTPAQVNLIITEVSGDSQQVYNIGPIKFIAGLSPQLADGSGFLDINPGARRVTPSGYQFLNMIISGHPAITVFKNGTQLQSFSMSPGIRTLKVDFAALGAAQGDIYEYRIVANTHECLSKFFKVMPEGYNSHTIIWENEYKLKSVMEFTGRDIEVKSDFDNRTQLLQQNLVDVLDKIESIKTVTLTINTGWLLQTDRPSVESLLRAKRAVLVLPGKNISLVPTGKTMTNVKAEEALISYDIEFTVNRQYNEEIYLF